MDSFSLLIHPAAEKELAAAPFPFRRQINQALHKLKLEPRPYSAAVLSDELWCLQVHGYTVIYAIDDAARRLIILRVIP